MRDTSNGSFPPNHTGSVAALPLNAGPVDRFSRLPKSWPMPMLNDDPASPTLKSSPPPAPPHECVPRSILSEVSLEEKRLRPPVAPDSWLEKRDMLPDPCSGRRVSIRNAEEAFSELSHDMPTRNGEFSPTKSRSDMEARKGDAPCPPPMTVPPMGPPEVEVMLANTASAMDEGRSPWPLLAALEVEIVRSFAPNLTRSRVGGGGLWGRNRSLLFPCCCFPEMGTKALLSETPPPPPPPPMWVFSPPVVWSLGLGSESGGIASRSFSSFEKRKGRSSWRRDMPGGLTVAHRCRLALDAPPMAPADRGAWTSQ
mmetsp:Transcript_620/g.1417  ORF Transcript_620/g.1417 Transcript_620/m.1417 type:complete len:312 (-) Transcript_620:1369-2304(-)